MQPKTKCIHWSAVGKVIEKREWRNEIKFAEVGQKSGVDEYVVEFKCDMDGDKKYEKTAVLPSFTLVSDQDWREWRESWGEGLGARLGRSSWDGNRDCGVHHKGL